MAEQLDTTALSKIANVLGDALALTRKLHDLLDIAKESNALKAKLSETERERDEAVALIDAAKSDVRPESFLENAQALLAKCVAPYSCEQMKVVADAMAQWYRKWELMSEVAMKAREDSDALKAERDAAMARNNRTYCAYCGHEEAIDADGSAIAKHIATCDMHPMRRVEKERDTLKASKDGAYQERDRLVALISKVFPAWLARHPDADTSWDNDWRWIVFVMLPTGQASWHIHDSELAWFDHLPREGAPEWDGHSTEEKYRRVESVATNHVADAGKMVAALKAKLAALAVAWDAYLNSEDEDRVAEWIALCEAFSAAKAAP